MYEHILSLSSFPLITALLLGLMTIFSPCPFCSNLAAVSYIAQDASRPLRVIWRGTAYTIGKIITYTVLSAVFLLGARIEAVEHFFEHYGEAALGPFLIICALFMFIGGKREEEPHEHNHSIANKINLQGNSLATSFLMGIVFSLAFCPYSGVIFFGMLIPLTMSQPPLIGWLMPIVYGAATGIPVIVIAWILSRSLISLPRINRNIKSFEKWLRIICAVIFLVSGIILTIHIFIGHSHAI
mgnify:CR=1 FL=1